MLSISRRFGKLGVFMILFTLLLSFFCISGCLERAAGPGQMLSPTLSDQAIDSRLQMDYDAELSRNLFRLQGDLLLPGASSLAYILLNASLRQGESPILTTKYLLMQIEPDQEYGFEICKNCRLAAGEYDCTLRVEGPQGVIAEESRKVCLEQSRNGPRGWSEAEEAALWRMIEEDEREKDEREADEREWDERRENESQEYGGGENKSEERSRLEEKSRALYSGDLAKGDRGEVSSQEDALLVGSITSKKYHRPNCRYAQKIRPENLISFAGAEDARAQGYLPCKVCSP